MTTTEPRGPKPTTAPKTRTDEELIHFTGTALAQIGNATRNGVLGVANVVYGENANGTMFTWFECKRMNNSRRLVKAWIILDGDDTYTVRGGYMDRKTFDWVLTFEESGIYADTLGATCVEAAESARTGKALA